MAYLNFLNIVLLISIVVTILGKYMTLNKIWVRKHENEVADSVSVSALILEMTYTIPFLLVAIEHFNSDFFIRDIGNIIRDVIVIFSTTLLFVIGIGYWINNGLSFNEKFRRALKMDRKEFKSLLKDVVQPGGIKQIFRVLCMFAIIDNELHEKEVELLKQFADEYDIDYDEIMSSVQKEFEEKADALSMKHMQQQVMDYIDTCPPKNVVIWLQDLIDKIIRADDVVTEEEDIASSEILASLKDYLEGGGDTKKEMYHILLIPQNKTEEEAILSIDDQLEHSKAQIFGSKKAYVADSYFSQRFAEIVRDKYVSLYKCFVTIEKY